MRLRWTLILLVVGAVLPVAAFAIYVASLVLDQEQQQFVAAVQARNRAFMSAVDTELAGQIETLRAVAASLNLDREDLRGFHAEAVAILETQHEWENLVLNAPDGAQLVNAVLPFGSPLPRGDAQSTVRVVQTGSPMVVDLRIRPITSTLAIPIRVPIVRKGRIRYVLTAVVRTSVFQHLLEKQELPKGWITGLADGENHFIARLPPRPTGSSVSRDFAAAIANAREGWYRGRTAEGVDTFTAFAKASLANWSIGVAIPSETVLASQHRAAVLMTSAGLVVLLVAGAIAFYVGRGISSPIATLAKAVEHLDKGPAIAVRTRIQEIRDLAAAMRRAAAGVADRQRLAAHERKLLADADRAKDEFLAMLSHELRNPLAAIVTASQLLKMAQPGSDVALSASDIIERQTRQMRRLVDDLLDVSSLVVGKATFEATVLSSRSFACSCRVNRISAARAAAWG